MDYMELSTTKECLKLSTRGIRSCRRRLYLGNYKLSRPGLKIVKVNLIKLKETQRSCYRL